MFVGVMDIYFSCWKFIRFEIDRECDRFVKISMMVEIVLGLVGFVVWVSWIII